MAESALPYPTHYHWINPWTCDTARDANVTARTAELVGAGLAEIPDPPDDLPESMVRLTPEGMAWVTRARTRDAKISTEGPVSTSPETGPGACRIAQCAWECSNAQSTKHEERTEGDT